MPASLVSSTPKALYPILGKNYAPKAELDDLASQKPTRNPGQLTTLLRTKYLEYKNRDVESYEENCNQGQLVANATSGKLLLTRHALTNQYMFVKRNSRFSDNKTVGGLFRFYRTKLDAEWLSSRPEIDPICPSDDDQIEEFIDAVKIQQDYYFQRFFDDQYELKEMDSAACFGTYITRYRYDPDKQDIVCELLYFPACRWDTRVRCEESGYFIYESKCSNAILEQLLDAEIAPDGDDDDFGQRIIKQIALQGGGVEGEGKNNRFGTYTNVNNENTVIEMWLQPEEYCEITLEANEPTMGGVDIPSGHRLMEMFPAGLCVVGINGMQTIIGLYAESHKDHIVSGIYHLQSMSGVGQGVIEAVDVKKDLDKFHSQKMTYVAVHSTPATYYAEKMISEENARNIGKPRKVIPVNFDNAPEGMKSINEAVQAIAPQNPGDGIWKMGEELQNNLQMAFQVLDSVGAPGGLPGVQNNTARGASITDANAQMILVPQHRNKADHRKRSAKVIYNLFKRFVNKPKFFGTKSNSGITKGRYLTGSQFNDVDIEFAIVANSEVAQTPFQQRDNMSTLFQFTGGLPGLEQSIMTNPDLASAVVTAFGVKLPLPKKEDITRVCRRRIEQAKKLLEVELQKQQILSAIGVPLETANLATSIVSQIRPRISPKEKFAPQKADWMAELLDSDELQYESDELRYVIETMIDWQLELQLVGQMQIEQDRNAAMVMSQLPMLLGEAVQEQSNQAMTQDFEAQQAQQQMQAEQQNMVAQNQQALAMEQQKADIQATQAEAQEKRDGAREEKTHERTKEMSDKSHAQALQIKSIEERSKIEQAKQKPKTGAK